MISSNNLSRSLVARTRRLATKISAPQPASFASLAGVSRISSFSGAANRESTNHVSITAIHTAWNRLNNNPISSRLQSPATSYRYAFALSSFSTSTSATTRLYERYNFSTSTLSNSMLYAVPQAPLRSQQHQTRNFHVSAPNQKAKKKKSSRKRTQEQEQAELEEAIRNLKEGFKEKGRGILWFFKEFFKVSFMTLSIIPLTIFVNLSTLLLRGLQALIVKFWIPKQLRGFMQKATDMVPKDTQDYVILSAMNRLLESPRIREDYGRVISVEGPISRGAETGGPGAVEHKIKFTGEKGGTAFFVVTAHLVPDEDAMKVVTTRGGGGTGPASAPEEEESEKMRYEIVKEEIETEEGQRAPLIEEDENVVVVEFKEK